MRSRGLTVSGAVKALCVVSLSPVLGTEPKVSHKPDKLSTTDIPCQAQSLPSYLLKEQEHCYPFQGYLRLWTPRSGFDSFSGYNDQNAALKLQGNPWRSSSTRGN